ncbi:c-type cytochrome [Pseudomonas sp. NPDC007930]|uniref:c-type cytochrome n=1 Tax=Pseudomonas sp. NPDC007930 TaxID=3364417 RepID=UPI0036E3F734
MRWLWPLLLAWASLAQAQGALERGEYLVNGLGHCGACHTPRGLWLQERSEAPLQGGWVQGWAAPAINGQALQSWSQAQLVEYLASGQAPGKAHAAGPMAEVIEQSLSRLNGADLAAIALYLRHVPGPAPAPASDGPANADLSPPRGQPRPANPEQLSAGQLFDAHCASCHRGGGRGLPALNDPEILARRASANLLMVILDGVQRGGETRMPGFAGQLTDRQAATLVNALAAPGLPALVPGDVAARRGQPPLYFRGWVLLGAAGAGLLLAVGALAWRLRRGG